MSEKAKKRVPWNKGKSGYTVGSYKNKGTKVVSEETKRNLSDAIKRSWAERKAESKKAK